MQTIFSCTFLLGKNVGFYFDSSLCKQTHHKTGSVTQSVILQFRNVKITSIFPCMIIKKFCAFNHASYYYCLLGGLGLAGKCLCRNNNVFTEEVDQMTAHRMLRCLL